MQSYNRQVCNIDNKNQSIGKAGRNRWLGKRPTVRGVVMNPVDHPHGEEKEKLLVDEIPSLHGDREQEV